VNRVDAYHFGQIVISGRKYASDVVIFPDRVEANWRRRKSHELALEEAGRLFAEQPEVLIVGTGAYGRVKVAPEVEQAAAASNIRLVVQPTGKACQTFNRLSPSQKAVAALHLTC